MKFIFLILSLAFAGCAPSKYLHYSEIKNNLGQESLSQLLIVGTGTSGTNLFLESISEELNKKLKSKNIKTVYYHLGNKQAEANRLFREVIALDKYDAVLQFAQLDETKDPIFLNSGTVSVPVSGNSIPYAYKHRQIRFQQQFLMKYFALPDLTNSIIDVKLDVNMDFVNPREYSKLAASIIKSLKLE